MDDARCLLRGIIDFGDNKLSQESRNANYSRLYKAGFEWYNPDERKIAEFIKDYVQDNTEPPSAAIIKDFFERANELTVTEKLLDVEAAVVYANRTHYGTLLKSLLDAQNLGKFRKIIQETDEIASKGRIIGKETVKGVKSALLYFNQKSYDAIPPENNSKTEGDIVVDTPRAWDEYQYIKANRNKAFGRVTGIEQIDVACKGIKKGELWIHAAAPGGLKTGFAMTWAYNLVTRYKCNVLYVSLEMKYEHLLRLACSMHSTNGVFIDQGLSPLDYRKTRDGELTPAEEDHYHNVLNHLQNDPTHCKFKVWAPDHDVTISDIRIYAELLHKSMEVGLIIIDHVGLVKPLKSHKDYGIEVNSVIRDSKKLALHFNGGVGIPVCCLMQINRDGIVAVEKKKGTEGEGVYSMTNLSYANEAERSADYITTTYKNDELVRQGAAILANIKNRDNDCFPPTKVRVIWASGRRLMTWEQQDQIDIGHSELTQEALDMLGPLMGT